MAGAGAHRARAGVRRRLLRRGRPRSATPAPCRARRVARRVGGVQRHRRSSSRSIGSPNGSTTPAVASSSMPPSSPRTGRSTCDPTTTRATSTSSRCRRTSCTPRSGAAPWSGRGTCSGRFPTTQVAAPYTPSPSTTSRGPTYPTGKRRAALTSSARSRSLRRWNHSHESAAIASPPTKRNCSATRRRASGPSRACSLHGPSGPRALASRVGVIPFTLDGLDHALVAAILGYEHGVGVRSGCFCAQPYMSHLLGLDGAQRRAWVRARSQRRQARGTGHGAHQPRLLQRHDRHRPGRRRPRADRRPASSPVRIAATSKASTGRSTTASQRCSPWEEPNDTPPRPRVGIQSGDGQAPATAAGATPEARTRSCPAGRRRSGTAQPDVSAPGARGPGSPASSRPPSDTCERIAAAALSSGPDEGLDAGRPTVPHPPLRAGGAVLRPQGDRHRHRRRTRVAPVRRVGRAHAPPRRGPRLPRDLAGRPGGDVRVEHGPAPGALLRRPVHRAGPPHAQHPPVPGPAHLHRQPRRRRGDLRRPLPAGPARPAAEDVRAGRAPRADGRRQGRHPARPERPRAAGLRGAARRGHARRVPGRRREPGCEHVLHERDDRATRRASSTATAARSSTRWRR